MTKHEWLLNQGYKQDEQIPWIFLKDDDDTNIKLGINTGIIDDCFLKVGPIPTSWKLYKETYMELGKIMKKVEDDLTAMLKECKDD